MQRKIEKMLNQARYHRNISENDGEAIKICDQILEIDKDNRDAMLIKAGALGGLYRNEEALRYINAIREKWPNHWEAYYLLGLQLFNKDEKKAMQALKKSLQCKETFDNLVVMAQLSYFVGEHAYQEYLDKAEKLDPVRFKRFMKNSWTYEL